MKGLIIFGIVMAVYFIFTLIFYCRAVKVEEIENMTKKEKKEYLKAKKEKENHLLKWIIIIAAFCWILFFLIILFILFFPFI